MIKMTDIRVVFQLGTPDESVLFDGFDFTIDAGDFVAVIGSNGSGKSTLLNLICGSIQPDLGEIYFNGRRISRLSEHKRAERIGRVFQDPKAGTCGNMTILENMALADNKNKRYGLSRGIDKRRREYYRELLETCGMGLENRLNMKVGNLSGGQRQALALVIANMSEIDILLLDEHTAALDPKSSETIMELTRKLIAAKKITTLMVTHNLRYALEYGNRLLMLDSGRVVIDISGEDKANAPIESLLGTFNGININEGNFSV